MSTIDPRETAIKVMRKVVVEISPKVIIRRLQNDNAFVIYANMNGTDTIHDPNQYIILIDIITEKTKPDFFKTIKKMIRIVDSDEEIKILKSHSYVPMFYSASVKDVKGDTIEKLIKFNSIDMVIPKYNSVKDIHTDDHIDFDDKFNIVNMMCNCAEFIKSNKYMLDKLYPANRSDYKYFRYSFAIMNQNAANDEILEKVITEDLYGYHISYDDKLTKQGKYELRRGDEHIPYFYKCKNKLCDRLHDDDCLIDLVLYYIAKSTLSFNEVFIKGEFIYSPLGFVEDDDFHIVERYLIPRTWFDFEGLMYVYDAKISDIVCNNCGKSLLPHFDCDY